MKSRNRRLPWKSGRRWKDDFFVAASALLASFLLTTAFLVHRGTLIVLSESGLEEVKDTAGMEGCRQCAKMAQGACQEAIDATLNARPDPQEGF